MIPSFDIGDLVRLGNATGTNDDGTTRAPFADILGAATDPTTVSLQVLKPNGTTLTYNWPSIGAGTGVLTREAVGRFYFDVALDDDGDWKWRLAGTGAVQTSEEGTLHVRWSAFP